MIKKNAPEVKKAVKNSDVAKDSAKVFEDSKALIVKNIDLKYKEGWTKAQKAEADAKV